MLEPLAPDLVLDPPGSRSRAGAGAPTRRPSPGWAPRFAVASFMHTSGTTGLPKFCAQSHDYFARLAAAMAGALDLGPADRVLAPLPLFHINPMGYGIITSLLTGADALTVRKFSASGLWPAVIAERVTVLILHAPAGGDPQARHHRRRRGRAPGAHDVLRRCPVPGAVRHPGGGVRLRLDRGRRRIPPGRRRRRTTTPGRRQPARGPGRRRHRLAARRPRRHPPARARARRAVRRLRHRQRARAGTRRQWLVRHRRPRPRRRR